MLYANGVRSYATRVSNMRSETKRRIGWSLGIAAGLVVLLIFVGAAIPYKEVSWWVCPVSGSTRREITWFGHFAHEERTVSALERWLRRREPGFVPNWQLASTDGYFTVGRSFACSTAPQISTLIPVLDRVVEKLDDNEISDLVRVLRYGSAYEQRKMIEKVADDAINKR